MPCKFLVPKFNDTAQKIRISNYVVCMLTKRLFFKKRSQVAAMLFLTMVAKMAMVLGSAFAFQFPAVPKTFRGYGASRRELSKLSDTTGLNTFEPVFDFGNASEDSIFKFERVDDAVMGGISTSTLRKNANEEFARWSGVCRLDGGYVLRDNHLSLLVYESAIHLFCVTAAFAV